MEATMVGLRSTVVVLFCLDLNVVCP